MPRWPPHCRLRGILEADVEKAEALVAPRPHAARLDASCAEDLHHASEERRRASMHRLLTEQPGFQFLGALFRDLLQHRCRGLAPRERTLVILQGRLLSPLPPVFIIIVVFQAMLRCVDLGVLEPTAQPSRPALRLPLGRRAGGAGMALPRALLPPRSPPPAVPTMGPLTGSCPPAIVSRPTSRTVATSSTPIALPSMARLTGSGLPAIVLPAIVLPTIVSMPISRTAAASSSIGRLTGSGLPAVLSRPRSPTVATSSSMSMGPLPTMVGLAGTMAWLTGSCLPGILGMPLHRGPLCIRQARRARGAAAPTTPSRGPPGTARAPAAAPSRHQALDQRQERFQGPKNHADCGTSRQVPTRAAPILQVVGCVSRFASRWKRLEAGRCINLVDIFGDVRSLGVVTERLLVRNACETRLDGQLLHVQQTIFSRARAT